MPRGGYRLGAGAKKGTKYTPRDGKGNRRDRIKLIKSIIKLLNKRTEVINKEFSAGRVYKCQQCGNEFKPGIKQGPKKYCSEDCRQTARKKQAQSWSRWQERVCKRCGSIFRTQNKSQYCSLKCASKVKSEKARSERPAYHCKKCGKEFYRGKRAEDSLSYCSRKCAGKGEVGKARYPRDWRAGNYRKRAKIKNVAYEVIDINAVFERDGWRCQICGKATPKENRGTHYHNAPEIDHRIPMSKGGGHTENNIQCACHSCNVKKSNKNEAGQLPLFSLAMMGAVKSSQIYGPIHRVDSHLEIIFPV